MNVQLVTIVYVITDKKLLPLYFAACNHKTGCVYEPYLLCEGNWPRTRLSLALKSYMEEIGQ